MRSLDDFLKGFLRTDEHEASSSSKWVEWEHISQGKTHCEDCLVLDGCWFSKAEKPKAPLHPYCHCITKPLPYSRVLDQANARSAYSKFDPYLFNTQGKYTPKRKTVQSVGIHCRRCSVAPGRVRETGSLQILDRPVHIGTAK